MITSVSVQLTVGSNVDLNTFTINMKCSGCVDKNETNLLIDLTDILIFDFSFIKLLIPKEAV